MRISCLMIAIALVCCGPARAEDEVTGVVLPNTQTRTLHSAHTGKTYQLSIALPSGYAQSNKRYPVMYLLDSTWNFAFFHGLYDTLFYAERVPETIIVGIDYGTPYAEMMRLREQDFTPTPRADKPGSGGGKAYLTFLEEELVPYIDQTFRTDPAERALAGHSYAGLFGVYAWLERPALFNRILAASPSVWWDSEGLLRKAEVRLASAQSPCRLDLSIGSEEGADDVAAVARFVAFLRAHPAHAGDFRYTLLTGENHNSAEPLSFVSGYSWIYASPLRTAP